MYIESFISTASVEITAIRIRFDFIFLT